MALYERTPFDTSRSMGRPIHDPRAQLYAQLMSAMGGGAAGGGGGGGGMVAAGMPPVQTAADRNKQFVQDQLVKELAQAGTKSAKGYQDQRSLGGGQANIPSPDNPGQVYLGPRFLEAFERREPDRQSQVLNSNQMFQQEQNKQNALDLALAEVQQKIAASRSNVQQGELRAQNELERTRMQASQGEHAQSIAERELALKEKMLPPNPLQKEEMESQSRARIQQILEAVGGDRLDRDALTQEDSENFKRRLSMLTEREQALALEMMKEAGYTKRAEYGWKEYLPGFFTPGVGIGGVGLLDLFDTGQQEAPFMDERKIRSPMDQFIHLLTGYR